MEALPPGDNINILKKMVVILKLIAELHKKGFVHRDIKPENIFIDEEGEPK